MNRKFRKKPVEIEAIQFTGEFSNYDEICDWSGFQFAANTAHSEKGKCDTEVCAIYIDTLEGDMRVSLKDWIIRGVQGEFYPCKPDIFEATYEVVE